MSQASAQAQVPPTPPPLYCYEHSCPVRSLKRYRVIDFCATLLYLRNGYYTYATVIIPIQHLLGLRMEVCVCARHFKYVSSIVQDVTVITPEDYRNCLTYMASITTWITSALCESAYIKDTPSIKCSYT